ncbi:MAG: type II secretion system GspH family protein [Methylovulum sp.]|nr:type II secretion system GspH family protein [Methylovulum sp.]
MVPPTIISKQPVNNLVQRGYTYFGILFMVALIGLALSGASMIWQVEQQREKERELLFIGQQYIDAIASYYHAAPGGVKKYPRTLEDLLRDSRYPSIKRYLRKPWRDPFTGNAKWGFVYTKQGGIAGIYSLGKGKPLKQSGFDILEKYLAGKISYSDWKFIYIAALDDTVENRLATSNENDANPDQDLADNTNPDADSTEDPNAEADAEEETGEELIPH